VWLAAGVYVSVVKVALVAVTVAVGIVGLRPVIAACAALVAPDFM
jgi:hypothetical protein